MRREGPAAVHRAILLLVLGMACLTAMDTVAKLLTAEMPVIQVAWARFFFLFAAIAPVFLRARLAAVVRPGHLRPPPTPGVLPLLNTESVLAGQSVRVQVVRKGR